MDTKERIFHKAVELFSAKGYHGTSIREIAREAGIKESSIYNHFKGKASILEAIMEYQLEGFKDSEAALAELKQELEDVTDPVEFWMAGANAFLSRQRPLAEPISRIIINEMFLNQQCRSFVMEKMYKAQRRLTEIMFNIMYEKGMIVKKDYEKLSRQYVALIQGLELEHKLNILSGEDPGESLNAYLDQMMYFIENLRR